MNAAQTKRDTVVRGERSIATEFCSGDRTDLPLLVLHGGPGFTRSYLYPELTAGLGRSAIYFDWPGCGASSRHLGSGYPLPEYVADVERVREFYRAEKVILMAHAWGAIPAMEYALAFPDFCASLILVNPLRILRAEGQDPEAQARMIAAADPRVTDPYVTELLPLIQRAIEGDSRAWTQVDTSAWWARMWRTQFLRPPPAAWANRVATTQWGLESYFAHKGKAMLSFSGASAQYDLAARAASLTCPLLIVGSDSDANYVAPIHIHAEPIHEATKGSKLSVISESGHFPFIDQQQAFQAAVSEFLRLSSTS
jgi:proline iminopeptidase